MDDIKVLPEILGNKVHIQAQAGGNLPRATVAIIINNCPIVEIEGSLKPAFKMSSAEAMDFANNVIYLAKLAEGVILYRDDKA